ncbi:MAG: efflux RND transporter periplasmic adaptor subunit [Myxococcota bacterium]
MLRTILRVVAPLLVLGAGAGALVVLVQTKPQAARQERTETAPLVEVVEAEPGTTTVRVEAMGTVVPARRAVIVPEVSGKVVEQHESLVQGGVVREGEALVRLDDRDYELMVDQREAEVARARVEVRVEEGRRRVAEREWSALEGTLPDTAPDGGRDLALRDPQIRAAKASLAAARSAVAQAKLSVERTTMEAPFNAYVQEESVEVGQWIGPQSRVATLVGSDTFWVEVAVPVDNLPWIPIPGTNAPEGEGAPARIVHEAGLATHIERTGRIIRLLPDLDPRGRMARLLVAVDDPLGLEQPPEERDSPLLVGAYVRVEISGRTLPEAVKVPRTALRDGRDVWVVDEDEHLRVRPVEIAWRDEEHVLVTAGLEPGERIVTSPLATPVPGMDLRVTGGQAAASSSTDGAPAQARPENEPTKVTR